VVSNGVGLAWYNKKSVGDSAGVPCTSSHWLAALDLAVNCQGPGGAPGQGVSLRRDPGPQPTARAVRQACQTLGIQPACTSDHTPQGHADTERVMRTLTAECLWRTAWRGPFAHIRALEAWIAHDNEHSLPATLGDTTPRQFEREDPSSPGLPFVAA
jgi:transposase InsO family protein